MSAKLLIDCDLVTLRRAIEIKEQIQTLTCELQALDDHLNDREIPAPRGPYKKRRKLSAAARARIAAAQRARWARLRA